MGVFRETILSQVGSMRDDDYAIPPNEQIEKRPTKQEAALGDFPGQKIAKLDSMGLRAFTRTPIAILQLRNQSTALKLIEE